MPDVMPDSLSDSMHDFMPDSMPDAMHASRPSPTDWPRTVFAAIVAGILYYMLASPAANIAQSTTLAPIAWPAPTFMIALLWRKPGREWAPYLLAVFVAMMFVGDLDWLPMLTDAGFALLNVVEIVACVLVGRRWVARDGQIDTLRKLTRFLLLLPLAVIALIAAAGATLASSAMHGDWVSEWRTLLVGNGLAVLVLVPALLAWSQPPRQQDATNGTAQGARVALAGVLAVAGALLAC